MAVGDRTGQVYANDQGKGLAVVIDTRQWQQSQQFQAQQREAQRQAKNKQFMNNMNQAKAGELKWSEYVADYRNDVDNTVNAASAFNSVKGVSPWDSRDPDAARIINNLNSSRRARETLNNYKPIWDKEMNMAVQNPEKYTEESIKSLQSFPKEVSYLDIKRGYRVDENGEQQPIDFPRLQYRYPSTLHSDYFVTGKKLLLSTYKDENGHVDTDAINTYTREYFSSEDPGIQDNLRAASQMYEKASDETKKSVRGYAAQNGFGENYAAAMMAMNMRNSMPENRVNMRDLAAKVAKRAPVTTIGYGTQDKETGRRTTGTKSTLPKDWALREATAILEDNAYMIDDPESARELGLDPEKIGAGGERQNAIRDALAKAIQENVALNRRHQESYVGETGGIGSDEILDSFKTDWLPRLYHNSSNIANEAAGFLTGMTFEGEPGVVESAMVITDAKAAGIALPGGANKQLILTFSDERTARAMREKAAGVGLKTTSSIKAQLNADKVDIEKQRAMYDVESEGRDVTIILDNQSDQKLLNLYSMTVKKTKRPFKSTFDASVDILGRGVADPDGLD